MNLEQHKSLKNVRILAKTVAEKSQEDQRIFETIKNGFKIFDFKPAKDKELGIEVVKFTRPNKSKVVSKDTEDRKSSTSGSKSKKTTRKRGAK